MAARSVAKGITRDQIIDAAWHIIDTQGASELSMRKLAAAVGVQPTTVYWHVGNRDAVIDAVVARVLGQIRLEEASGDDLNERLFSMASGVRREVLARPALVDLLASEHRIESFFVPLAGRIFQEIETAGLPPKRSAEIMRALLVHVMGFVLVERQASRQAARPDYSALAGTGLRSNGDDDLSSLFEFSVRAHIDALMNGDRARSR
jgi:TetR/AcrR family transcriptional regulator, tetracycline repressor protein